MPPACGRVTITQRPISMPTSSRASPTATRRPSSEVSVSSGTPSPPRTTLVRNRRVCQPAIVAEDTSEIDAPGSS